MTKSARRATGRNTTFKGGNHVRQPHGKRDTRQGKISRERQQVPIRLAEHLYVCKGVAATSQDELVRLLADPSLGIVHKSVRSPSRRKELVQDALDLLTHKKCVEIDLGQGRCRYRLSRKRTEYFAGEDRRRTQQSFRDRQERWERTRRAERVA